MIAQSHVDEILDEFDFARVLLVMRHLNWEWRGTGIPTLGVLRREARRLLDLALLGIHTGSKQYSGGSGGFWVRATPWDIRLTFEVQSWTASEEDAEGDDEMNLRTTTSSPNPTTS